MIRLYPYILEKLKLSNNNTDDNLLTYDEFKSILIDMGCHILDNKGNDYITIRYKTYVPNYPCILLKHYNKGMLFDYSRNKFIIYTFSDKADTLPYEDIGLETKDDYILYTINNANIITDLLKEKCKD